MRYEFAVSNIPYRIQLFFMDCKLLYLAAVQLPGLKVPDMKGQCTPHTYK